VVFLQAVSAMAVKANRVNKFFFMGNEIGLVKFSQSKPGPVKELLT
jgi:hypothetical protein